MEVEGATDAQIEKWAHKYHTVSVAVVWIYAIISALLLAASSVTAIVVCCVRGRRDCFAISSLACYVASSAIFAYYSIYNHSHEAAYDVPEWIEFLANLGNFCYLMAHWAFSAQYLKTSMVLPRLLTQAKLEYTSADTIRRERRLSNRAMNRSSLELLRSVDDAIDKEKAALRRIIIKIVVYNVIMTLLIAGQSVFNLKCFDWIDSEKLAENISENLYEAILLLT